MTPHPAASPTWVARQAALPIDTGGDRLEPHEIEFLERFLSGGERIRYIPRDTTGYTATNDFEWLSHDGIEVEVKSVLRDTITTKSIVRPIRRAVKKAATGGRIKENFIVDIREHVLLTEVRDELALYNRDNPHAVIRTLFIFSRGCLIPIRLK